MKSTREILLQRSSFELSQALKNQYRIGGIEAVEKTINGFVTQLGSHEGEWRFVQQMTRADVNSFLSNIDLDMNTIMAGEETYH